MFSPRQRNYMITSSPAAVQNVDAHIQKMENALHRLEKVQGLAASAPGSVMRLREAELQLLEQIEVARDFMQCALQSCNRTLLIELFGGDHLGEATRTAKIRSIIDKAHFSVMYSDDPRVPGCLSACESVECVFRDSHWGRALETARKQARKKREQEWLNKIKVEDQERLAAPRHMEDRGLSAKTKRAEQQERLTKTRFPEEQERLVKFPRADAREQVARTRLSVDLEQLAKTQPTKEQEQSVKTPRADEHEQLAKTQLSVDLEQLAETQPTEGLDPSAKTLEAAKNQLSKTQLTQGKENLAETLEEEHKHLARVLAEEQEQMTETFAKDPEQLPKMPLAEKQEELVKTQLVEVECDKTGDDNRDADEEDDKDSELATILENLEKYESEQCVANKTDIVKLANELEEVNSKHRDCATLIAIFQWSFVSCVYRQISHWF